MRLAGLARAHPRVAVAGAAGAILLAVGVLVWFQPQKLFIDERVDEELSSGTAGASPGSATAGAGRPPAATSPPPTRDAEPRTLARGSFRSLEHETTGTAILLELPDGSRTLRLEDLRTSNGPDLVVYLSRLPANLGWRDYGREFLDLGRLKGNIGSQNYEIPAGTDLSGYRSAVVWCRRFTVGFGVAPLDP